jgi:hypothetical protein
MNVNEKPRYCILCMQIEEKARLLAHGGCSSLAEIGTGGLGFGDTLREDGGVFALEALLV